MGLELVIFVYYDLLFVGSYCKGLALSIGSDVI